MKNKTKLWLFLILVVACGCAGGFAMMSGACLFADGQYELGLLKLCCGGLFIVISHDKLKIAELSGTMEKWLSEP